MLADVASITVLETMLPCFLTDDMIVSVSTEIVMNEEVDKIGIPAISYGVAITMAVREVSIGCSLDLVLVRQFRYHCSIVKHSSTMHI